MKIKRIIFIASLVILFLGCYVIMDSKYDPLARYQYVTASNHDIILNHMDDDDIEYIVSQKIKPEQFMDFIQLPGFETRNILYYEICKNEQPTDLNFIISFVNTYRSHFRFSTFPALIRNYLYHDLQSFYDDGYRFIKGDVELIEDPSKFLLLIDNQSIVWKYMPKELISVDNSIMPSISNSTDNSAIQIKEDVREPLKKMTDALAATNNLTSGGLILNGGFVSFEQQIEIYEKALTTYGFDKFQQYADFPGQNEQQLGYTLTFTIANLENTSIEESAQVKWINENAHKYGFIVRYPKGKEKETGKLYQPLTLRYVGEKVAKEVYTSKKTFNEIKIKE